MPDLHLTGARAALLRCKLAADDGAGGNALAMLEGAGGIGLMGGAANWARSAYRRTPPSIMQLAEQLWQDPENAARFKGHLDPGTSTQAARALELIKEDPRALRRMLMGERVVGIPDHIADTVRNLTFGSPHKNPWTPGHVTPQPSRPGDVLLHTPVDEMANRWGRLANTLSGNAYNHAAVVGDREIMHNFTVTDKGRSAVETSPLRDVRHDNLSFLRLRDTSLSPEQVEALKTKIPETYQRTVDVPDRRGGSKKAPMPFDYRRSSNLGLRELAPELGTASGGSLLGGALDMVAGNKTTRNLAKRILPESQYKSLIGYRHLADRCGPGEVCSTMAGRALESVGAPVAKNMAPGDVLRATGPDKRFRVEEIHLPAYMRNRDYLAKANLRRWGPLAVRAPAMLGMFGLGAYGVHDAMGRMAETPKNLQQKLPTPAAPAPLRPSPPVPPPTAELPARQAVRQGVTGALKGAVGGWWQRMQARYGQAGPRHPGLMA